MISISQLFDLWVPLHINPRLSVPISGYRKNVYSFIHPSFFAGATS